MTGTNGNGNGVHATIGTDRVKMGLAQMLKGGVIVSTLYSIPSSWNLLLATREEKSIGRSIF
jgi:hypothetical protein